MKTWIERLTPLEGDTYVLRRRPGTTQVVLNDAYQGLRCVDPWSGAQVGAAAFPPRFRHEGGAVHLLYLSADGASALVATQEEGGGALLDLDGGQARDLPWALPGPERSWRYTWDERGLACADARGERFFGLAGAEIQKLASLQVRKAWPQWRKALHQATFPHGRALRVYPDEGAMVCLRRDQPGGLAALLRASWRGQPELECLPPGPVDDAAALEGQLFYLQRGEVWAQRPLQRPALFWQPEPGWEVRGVETLAAQPDRPAALVLLLRHKVDVQRRRLWLVPLEGRPDPSSAGPGQIEITGQSLQALPEALREAAQHPQGGPVAALALRNTAHPLFLAQREALREALALAWGRSGGALAGLRAVRLLNGHGAHDFDAASLLQGG
jgi:hypothetical protein